MIHPEDLRQLLVLWSMMFALLAITLPDPLGKGFALMVACGFLRQLVKL